MVKRIFALLFCLISYFGYSHDLRMAVFEIYKEDNRYQVKVDFDKADLLQSVLTANQVRLDELTTADRNELIVSYINQNFQVAINGHCQEMSVTNITEDADFIHINLTLGKVLREVLYVDVFNTCLIDYHAKHMNIVKALFHDKLRTFRLSSERLTTTIDYR